MNFQVLHDDEFQELHDITKITLYYIKTYEFQEPLDTTYVPEENAETYFIAPF
jgi:hypothetical protein